MLRGFESRRLHMRALWPHTRMPAPPLQRRVRFRRVVPNFRLLRTACHRALLACTNSFATVIRVRVDSRTELVIATDIARRLGISPQRVYVLVSGPGFPRPLGMLGRSAVWRWSTVERWARETGRMPVGDAA